MAEYARQAKDTELIGYATEIRLRAERRAGAMLAEMAERGDRDDGRGNRNPTLKSQAATPKLADLGITKWQSSRWQQLAALSEPEFEGRVGRARRRRSRPSTAWQSLPAKATTPRLPRVPRREQFGAPSKNTVHRWGGQTSCRGPDGDRGGDSSGRSRPRN